jgi:hypothetical protein
MKKGNPETSPRIFPAPDFPEFPPIPAYVGDTLDRERRFSMPEEESLVLKPREPLGEILLPQSKDELAKFMDQGGWPILFCRRFSPVP